MGIGGISLGAMEMPLLRDDIAALDFDEVADFERVGNRSIDRLDGIATIRTEVDADVLGVNRVREAPAAAGVVRDRSDDALAMVGSALLIGAHALLKVLVALRSGVSRRRRGRSD